jgi:hypothetical protein
VSNSLLSVLNQLTDEQMIVLRDRINTLLPSAGLMSLNLETELVENYKLTVTLYNDIIHDETVPANQKAQVVNSCSSLLKTIAELQESVHGTEQVKKLQNIFVATLKELPNSADALLIYERHLTQGK